VQSKAIFRPWPGAQTEFMSFDGRYCLYGGAAGPGKTDTLRYYPFRQIMIEDERVARGEISSSSGRSIIFRRTMPELREIMDRNHRDFSQLPNPPIWHEQTKTYTFPCGYKYMVGQMEEAGDWSKYFGFEFTLVGFDELCTFLEEQHDQMDNRLRSTDPVLSKMLWMRSGTNPVGPGVEWVKRRYVDVAPPRTLVVRRIKVSVLQADGTRRSETVERHQKFIPGLLHDNPAMDAVDYAATLSTHSVEVMRQLLDGDWTVVRGAWVGELWEPSVHVIKPFKIPNGYFRFRMCDYGYDAKASVQWGAVDFDNNITIYRSLTVRKHTAEMLAYRIKEMELGAGEWDTQRGCSMLSGPLDSSCWNTPGSSGPTIAEDFFRVGVFWTKSDKNRHGAANQIRQRLMKRTGHPTIKDKDGKAAMIVPGIRWFNTCKGPVSSIPILPKDKDDGDVPDTDADDHDYDAVGYGAMYRPLVPERKDYVRDPLDPDYIDDMAAAKMKRQQRGKLGYGMW
jgi:hypothetical protein